MYGFARTASWVLAISVLAASTASAQSAPDYFSGQESSRPSYRVKGDRTVSQRLALVSLAGATVLAGGVGVLFTLRYQDAAGEVEAFAGEPTNRVYSEAVDARRRDAERASVGAGVAYGIGVGLLAATVITYIVTDPEDELRVYGSGVSGLAPGPVVVPFGGGALVGARWTY